MLKLFIRVLSGVGVLMSGLISCAPEKPKTLVFNAEPPMLIISGRPTALKAFDHLSRRQVDLNDQVNFQPTQSSQVRVTTRCQIDKKALSPFQRAVSGASSPLMFQLLPPEALLTKPSAEVLCSMEFRLIHPEGAQKVFQLVAFEVTDQGQGAVFIGRDREPGVTVLRTFDFKDISIRYSSPKPLQAQVVCSYATTTPLPFHHLLDLRAFRFDEPGFAAPVSAAQAEDVAQFCRVHVRDQHQTLAISPKFQLLPQKSTLKIDIKPYAELVGKCARDWRALAEVRITNPSPGRRWFSVPQGPHPVSIGGTLADSTAWAFIMLKLAPGKKAFDFELAPGQSVNISVHAAFELCNGRVTHTKAELHSFTIQEFDAQGKLILEVPTPAVTVGR